MRVLITGVRGKTGRPLADLLVARDGVEVRGGTARPDELDLPGVEPVAFAWEDPATWAGAAEGVDAVFVVRPDHVDAPALVAGLLDAVGPTARVVLVSDRAAGSAGAGGAWAQRVEDVVRSGGRPWVVLRPSWFLQVLTDPRFVLDDVRAGTLPFSAGDAAVAWIDARDIAAVAEQALLDPRLDGRVLELTGPEALTLPETAAALTEGLGLTEGRGVVHVDLDVADVGEGLSEFERALYVETNENVRAGVFAPVTATVPEVVGRPAYSIRDFVADHRDELRGA